MTKRRKLTKGQREDILVRQRWLCEICRQPIARSDKIEWDHVQPLALGGTDELANICAVHSPCHKLKTHGAKRDRYELSHADHRLGSDFFRIAKVKRIKRKLAKDWRPNRRKIKSRGFDKTLRRKMDGTVEKKND
jgi:hypothetical protein